MSLIPVSLRVSQWGNTAGVPYLLMALALAGALAGVLAMYFSLKREIAAYSKRNRRVEAMLLRLKDAGAAVATGTQRVGADTDAEAFVFAPAAPRSGMNLNRRVQALRLLRRGEDLGHIASALGVPRCEVELLVRVHRLSIAGLAGAAGAGTGGSPAAFVSPRSQAALTGTP
jgi:hypothetical protein